MSLRGTCDGLLLFETSNDRDHFVCNPVTRQRLVLLPSGEHLLLYLADDEHQPGTDRTASHRELSLGAAEARRVGPPAAGIEIYTLLLEAYLCHRGSLHWLHHPVVVGTDKILAFDTLSATFRRMPRPPLSNDFWKRPCFLLEVDGNLAVAAVLDGSMDLWVLEDYAGSDGSWRHHLRDGNYVVVLYDLAEKKALKQFEFASDSNDDDTRPTGYVFRDSLERHAFFDLQDPKSAPCV
ncbi:uncharacterized protein C2845_PM14G05290 [Panicum miliaceum]|uniref:F-box associated domain-containing protein n=1 Tax=Panicum miliaceum TaxID=4540 RepID=A0A3L6PQZ5_PANMI|nr:uncharacterized protein C2845_PM14G05290 [Panicum miliaceum]